MKKKIRPESAETKDVFKKNRIKVLTATVDNEKVVKAMRCPLGLDGYLLFV